MMTIKKILVATDFSEAAGAAYRYGKDFARTHSAHLHVLHVVSDLASHLVPVEASINLDQVQGELEKEGEAQLAALTDADRRGLNIQPVVLVSSAPARTILSYARDEHIDLIVMGTEGRTGLQHLLLGSVAQRVVQAAPCPVLTVHHPEREFVHPDALQVVGRYEKLAKA